MSCKVANDPAETPVQSGDAAPVSGPAAPPAIFSAAPADLPWPRLAVLAAWGVILAGAGLRAIRYLFDRSLWLDEASLALNFVRRDFAGLFRTLDHEQGAPLGFLLATEAATRLLGVTEHGLRLVPVLAGVLSLPVMYVLLRRIVRWEAALVALAFFAMAESGIYYASEAKQYSSDILAAAVVLYVGASVLAEGYTRRNVIALFAVGLLAPWFSFPSLFTLPAVGLTLIARAIAQRRENGWRDVRLLVLVGCAWAANVVVVYFVSMRAIAANPFFKNFWRNSFLPFPPRGIGDLRQYPAMFFRAVPDALGVSFHPNHEMIEIGALVGVLFLVGLLVLALRRDWKLPLIAAPLLLVMLAAMMKAYPFSNRLIVFLSPVLVLGMAVTLGWMVDLCRTRRDRAVAWGLLIGLLIVPAGVAASHLWPAPTRQETREAMAIIAREKQPGDRVFVDFLTREPFDFYSARFGLRGLRLEEAHRIEPDMNQMAPAIADITAHRRVWVLMASVHPNMRRDPYLNLALEPLGKRLRDIKGSGYRLTLYDFSQRPTPATTRSTTQPSPAP